MTAATLEERVAALEARESLDTLSPTYLTLDGPGKVGAAFTGKLSATELDLTAGADPSPIRWLDAGGAQVAVLSSDAVGVMTLSGAFLKVLNRISGGNPPGGGVTTTENNGHSVEHVWDGARLKTILDGATEVYPPGLRLAASGQDVRIAWGSTQVNLPNGWSRQTVQLGGVALPGNTQFGFYSVSPRVAMSSIVSSELAFMTISTVVVDINLAGPAQNTIIYAVAIGT